MSVDFSRFSLYKRRNGVYSILYYHHGRRRWKSTKATATPEALAFLSQFRELLGSGVPSVPLQDFVTRFLSYAQSTYSTRTTELYRRVLYRFLRFAGDICLVEITPEHFDKYKAQRIKEKYEAERVDPKSKARRLKAISPVSFNIELRALRAALATAKRWKLVSSNPFQDVNFVVLPDVAPMFFTASDFQRLLEAIKEGWLREVVFFAVSTPENSVLVRRV